MLLMPVSGTIHFLELCITYTLSVQVGRKVEDVYRLISSQQEPLWRNYALYMFAVKVTCTQIVLGSSSTLF